jgi:hypothetical protein
MTTFSQRLKRLEQLRGDRAGRLIVVNSYGAATEEVQSVLRANGLDVGPSDRLVHFSTIYEDREGNPIPSMRTASLLCVSPL